MYFQHQRPIHLLQQFLQLTIKVYIQHQYHLLRPILQFTFQGLVHHHWYSSSSPTVTPRLSCSSLLGLQAVGAHQTLSWYPLLTLTHFMSSSSLAIFISARGAEAHYVQQLEMSPFLMTSQLPELNAAHTETNLEVLLLLIENQLHIITAELNV